MATLIHLAEFNRNRVLGIDPKNMTKLDICRHLRAEFNKWNSRIQTADGPDRRKVIQTKMDLLAAARLEHCSDNPSIIIEQTNVETLEIPLAPWKLSLDAIKLISNIGFNLQSFGIWDIRCYALDGKYRVNPQFLGITDPEERDSLYNTLFDSYGQPRDALNNNMQVDPSTLVEDGGNLLEMLIPNGKFKDKMQPILKSEQIRTVIWQLERLMDPK